LEERQNHDVMGEDEQAKIAALAVIAARADMRALAAFDHGDHGFHLGSPTVRRKIEALLHKATVATAGRLFEKSSGRL
jgi:hypothetical protein